MPGEHPDLSSGVSPLLIGDRDKNKLVSARSDRFLVSSGILA